MKRGPASASPEAFRRKKPGRDHGSASEIRGGAIRSPHKDETLCPGLRSTHGAGRRESLGEMWTKEVSGRGQLLSSRGRLAIKLISQTDYYARSWHPRSI